MLENEIPWNSQRGMRRIMDDTVESLIETECCLFIIYDEPTVAVCDRHSACSWKLKIFNLNNSCN